MHRARTLCVLAALSLFAMIAVSSRRELWVWYNGTGNNYQLGLSGGNLTAFWATDEAFANRPGRQIDPGFSVTVDKRWDDTVSLAWRPYHIGARPGFNPGDTHHGFVLPLWLPATLATIAAAYTQGHLTGFRRGDRGHCAKCGYNRAGLAGDAPCPECGVKGRV